MFGRRNRIIALVMLGLGLGTFAVAESGWLGEQRVAPPIAVHPAGESPTPTQLERQRLAIAQPRGALRNGTVPARPVIASPNR